MLQISELQRSVLVSAGRLNTVQGLESLVGLTFEETVFYLSFMEVMSEHGMRGTKSARHFEQLERRHRHALDLRNNGSVDLEFAVPPFVAL
ncbi:hypothetical protein [Pseudoduganella sp. UC29_71]|uniref:hypothetical protein n=1 Tax=Pseudoduganella sp. UC29_71 TaxID=3350174 RepID=UPI00366AB573